VRLRQTPTQFGKQPHSGLFDKLVFGVGVRAHARAIDQSNEPMTADSTPFVPKGNPLKSSGASRFARF
jgi:hypothetical protein